MKKLDKEQLPKVIALGALAALLLGYAAFTMLGHSGPQPAPAVASTPHPAPAPAGGDPRAGAKPRPPDPELALAPIDHENPFIPVFQATTGLPAPRPALPAAKPAHPKAGTQPASAQPAAPPAPKHGTAAPAVMMAALPDRLSGPALDGDPGVAFPAPVSPAAARRPAASPAAPPAASRPKPAHPQAATRPAPRDTGPKAPAVVVTGILEGQENVAILKLSDARSQVVRKGDRLEGGYVVKQILSDAVVLTLGSHQWVVRISG